MLEISAQVTEPSSSRSTEAKIYANETFNFKVTIPGEWRAYDDETEGEKKLLVQWELPGYRNEESGTFVESNVYIRAFRSESTTNVDNMILNAYLSIAGKPIALSAEEGTDFDSRILYMDMEDGSKYKGKVYFKYNNGVGYRITYMTRPWVYEKDLAAYEAFIDSLEFID